MKDIFETFINNRVTNANSHDVKDILNFFTEKKYNKGAYFKLEDTCIEHLGFLVTGSARSYFANEKGEEISYDLVEEKGFISDIISVRTQDKTPIVIQFLEDSQVLIANMEEVRRLLEYNLVFNILIREYIGDRAMELLRMHHFFLNGTASERYRYLLASNPTIMQKYPLRLIASMIGVTPTHLSRIRNERL